MVTPGDYSVSLFALNKGAVKQLSEAVSFQVKPLYEQVLEPSTPAEIKEFRTALESAILEFGALNRALKETTERLKVLEKCMFPAGKRWRGIAGRGLQCGS